MNRIKFVDQTACQQRCQEIAELATNYLIIVMLVGVIEFTYGLVEPHEYFELPMLGIRLVRNLRIEIQIAFEDNCTEYPLLLAENIELVIPGLLCIGEPVVFLLSCLPGIPERVKPLGPPLVFGFLFPERDLVITLENSGKVEEVMLHNKGGVPLARGKEVQDIPQERGRKRKGNTIDR